MYDRDDKLEQFKELPPKAENYGLKKQAGKGKGKGKSSAKEEIKEEPTEDGLVGALPKVETLLNCLDVFSGAGGLRYALPIFTNPD